MDYHLFSTPLFVQSWVHDPRQIILILGFVSIFIYHTRHQVPLYHRKFQKNNSYLFVHILTGVTEVLRYRIDQIFHDNSETLPDAIGVLSSLIWSWTSFELVKTLRRGDPRTTRPPYQAVACLRPVVTLSSYLFGLPSLHRVSISSLDSFIWARVLVFFFSMTPYIASYSYSTMYAISIPLSGVIALQGSGVPGAWLVYALAAAYTVKLNDWVTEESRFIRQSNASTDVSTCKRILVNLLLRLGFADIDELRAVAKIKELEHTIDDDYVSKENSQRPSKLPMRYKR